MLNRRAFIRGAVAIAAVASLAAGQPAGAQPAAAWSETSPVIEIAGTPSGFTMAASHPAGFVTFHASTTHSAGALFALLRLRPEANIDELLEHLMLGLSDVRAEAVAGGRGTQERAELLGGAAVQPGQPLSFTSLLRPGTYYVVNYRDLWEGGVPQAAARLHTLTITGHWSASAPPQPAATSTFVLSGDRAAYLMPSQLRSNQPLLMVNAMPQLTEAVFMPVLPGTTKEQLRVFFAAADREDWSVPAPFIGGPVGLPALSPGAATAVQVALPRGEYVLVTWYPNFNSGTMLAAQGQFQLVTII